MGSWDCYCALCCGPLGKSSVKVGDGTKKALKRRARIVAEGVRERKGIEPQNIKIDKDAEEASDNDDEKGEQDRSATKSNDNTTHELHHGNPKYLYPYNGPPVLDTMYKIYEKESYDPRLLHSEDVEWTDRCRTLGYNPNTGKAFISGLARYAIYGDVEIHEPGNDPNDPQLREYDVYQESTGELDDPTFPFHEACYRLLVKRLGYVDSAEIDKHLLFNVMLEKNNGYSCLMVDYGDAESLGKQWWYCQPGEEYFVCDPGQDAELPRRFPNSVYSNSPRPNISHKVHHDPFNVLPFDILHIIIHYLSVKDTLSLIQASYHVNVTTADSQFWASMIRKHLVPFFWETLPLIDQSDLLPNLDYKTLFLWLDKVTTPGYGIAGPFMHVANRRRIWGVCEQLAPAYKRGIETTLQKE